MHYTLALALAATAAAQTSVVSILLPEWDPQPLVASVIAAAPTATSYVVRCPMGTDSSDCGIGDADATIINGPETWEMHFTGPATAMGSALTLDASCRVSTAANEATCTQLMGPVQAREETVITGISAMYQPVTITAGLEKLTAANAMPSMTSSGGMPGETASHSHSPGMSMPTGSAGAGATSSSSNPAPPQKTQNAVLAGVAAVVGGIMML